MASPILTTKLYIPPVRSELVSRPRLIEHLNEGLRAGRKLTLISAPAGFGKTTLVSNWINQKDEGGRIKDEAEEALHPSSFILHPSNVAWLSLDEADNDFTRFLAYLVTALQTIAPHLGADVLATLQSPQPLPMEVMLTALVNEIATVPGNFALVLDDYHMIEDKPVNAPTSVNDALTFLLEHLPPQMHLIIATREDPNLPLARLRVRGQLTELRAADLRFTPAEAAQFLNQVMGLNLSADDVNWLETRTEGWIAGLQLAALALQRPLSMPGQQDVSGFIRAFAGDNRYIVDYLVEEILQHQPKHVQMFLRHTSILDRMCGSLCEAVLSRHAEKPGNDAALTGQFSPAPLLPLTSAPTASAQDTLEYLERANLLIVPLDDKRQWYRYHHLFADVLQARLIKEQPEQVRHLHRRACEWFEQNDLRPDAIRHALAAEAFERAADLIELAWSQIRMSYFQNSTYLEWVKALPYDLIRTRPVLSVSYAWELLNFGELEAAKPLLEDAERWLEPAADTDEPAEILPAKMKVVNQEEFASLRVSLANACAFHAQSLGDAPKAINYARRTLALASEADVYPRGVAASLLGLAYWTTGELEPAYNSLADGMASLQLAGNISFALSGTFAMADIRMAQGRLHQAISTYEQSLKIAAAHGESTLQGMADLYLGLGDLYYEQGHLDIAGPYLLKSETLSEHLALPNWHYRFCLAQAKIKQAQGDLDGALDQLDEAERLYYRVPIPEVRPIAARKALVWMAQGKLNKALAWAGEQGLAVTDDLSYMREFEHITLARLFIAQYQSHRQDSDLHQALDLLNRLLQAAEAGDRSGSVIEILVSQALAYQTQGNIPAALAPLERALALAEPEGYIRLFVSEGPPMAELLKRLKAEGGRMKKYINRLLAAFSQKEKIHPFASAQDKPSVLSLPPLVEPLSDRELEVLRLVAQGFSNREISERLFLALDTIKGHNRRIFGKLQVQRRTEAVARARELGLL